MNVVERNEDGTYTKKDEDIGESLLHIRFFDEGKNAVIGANIDPNL